MADKNEGIIVLGAIRPQYPNDVYAVAYSEEIRGGFHSVTSSTDRDSIYSDRRKWGMLCYVIDENKTYQLQLNSFDSDLNQNANWVLYNPSPEDDKWSLPVIDFTGTVPGTVNDGDRYIIATPSYGAFANRFNQFAQYSLSISNWVFSNPTDQTTVRVTNEPNCVAIFIGTQSSSGKWVKEYQNEVRYISPTSDNGLTYSFTSKTYSQIFTYSNAVYYTIFATSNSGAVSLSIDGLEYIDIKKVTSNTLVDLVSGDIVNGPQYQLTFDSQNFQITLPTDGNTDIGNPEVGGGYTHGLYQDFTTSTPVGTVVDRFNELFKYLTPPSAPNINSWSVASQSQFVTGKISFGGSGGFTPGTASIWNPTATGGLFATSSSGSYVLGIRSGVTQQITGTQYYQDIYGTLNSGVGLQGSVPTPAYSAYSFGNGTTGSLNLYLNSNTVSSLNLGATGYQSIDTTNSGLTSGFVLSTATTSKYELGYEFDFYWNRTGTYRIKRDNPLFVNGLNHINVVHNLGTTAISLNRYEFINDTSNALTTFGTPQATNFNSTFKLISGIRLINSLNFQYAVEALNVYSNTYYPNSDAGVFFDNFDFLTPNPASQSLTVPNSVSSTFTFSTAYTLKSNRRRTNQTFTTNISVKRTVQGQVFGGTLSLTNWLVDTFATSSTLLVENFDDERYRLVNTSYTAFSNISSFSSSAWNSQVSLYTGTSSGTNYRDALQCLGGTLVYPNIDFASFGDSISNRNYGLTSASYNLCAPSTINTIHGSSSRSYTRYFKVSSQSSSIRVNISAVNTNFVPVGSNLNSSLNAYLEFKLPYKGSEVPFGGTVSDGGVTGWLDASKNFIPNNYENGAGCWDQTNSSGSYSLAITFGQKNTYFSNGNILMRITTGSNYVGHIDQVVISSN